MTSHLRGGLLVLTLLGVMSSGSTPVLTQTAGNNPIVLENQQAGSNSWLWTQLGDDVAKQIKGYASTTSAMQGENINFYVTVNPAQTYTIDIYRIGWYGGLGGRLRSHIGPLDGVQQPPCSSAPDTGLLACDWTPSYTLTVPSDWTSGVYVALLTNAQGYQNYMKFVVRDGRPAAFLYQHAVATDQAYNNYPDDNQTGKSLYNFNSFGPPTTVTGSETRAIKVSFDRPFADLGSGAFFNWEIQLIRWLEHNGYDVTYSTDIDTHVNGGELRNHKAFFSTGHNEYWTKEMYDAAENARDNGVNLAFFGADAVYTQIRLEPSAAGVANKVMVCYRWTPDPVQGPTTTTEFRSAPVNRPEQSLMGVQYFVTMPNTDYVVTNSSHWAYKGTGFSDGDAVRGIVGYEADIFMPAFPAPNSTNQTLLSKSPTPFTDKTGAIINSSSSIYQAPSGAWVFASGTMSWSWALDDVPGRLSNGRLDARIQRTTANILNAFLNGVPPTITSMSPASGAVGSAVMISGSSFTGTTAVSFNGTPATFTVLSDATIQATVPAGAILGPLSVTTPGGTATSATNFAVVPAITSFTPTSGVVGTTVTISGTSLTGATAVTFNGVNAAGFTVTSDSAIQAAVPATATAGPIVVTTPGGTATSATNFSVVPTITGFTPTSGVVGTSVTISGTSLTSATAVTFNGVSAASFTVTSDTAIQATVPATATAGPIGVTTPGGTATSANNFGVLPAITSFAPASSVVGTSVTISGTSLTGATAVTFNGVNAASFTVTSDTAIQATVPATATTGPLRVTTPGGTATSAANFSVVPTITSFTPTSGVVGTTMTISGTSFTGATAVTFNGVSAASFTVTSNSAIQAIVPATVTTGPVRVTTPGGTATSAANFIVVPTITGFTPTSGVAGTTVTISGTSLTGTTAVTFNGVSAASFTVTSDSAIQATVPAAATTGPLSVTTPGGTATSAASFIVVPTITGFTPTSGVAGTTVTIGGTSFTGATAVTFNGVNAASFTVISNSAIQATAPATVTTGPLTVTTPSGTATSAANFIVVPTITGFTPASGVVGTTVTISGTSLTGARAVTFSGVNAASFTVTSDTAIQATVPGTATTGPIGVTTPGGTATSAANFNVVPAITSFTPTSGVVGTTVTISGTSLTGATAVTFNGANAASFTVTSNTAILATVPAAATPGPLRVTTAGGTATSAANFIVVPTITGFTPTSGVAGTTVTISGTSLTGATAVTFNGVNAASFTVTSNTAIQATVPATAAPGPLRVTTPGGTATSATNFTTVPTITGFTPTSGAEGASVTVNGANLAGATAVTFNGLAAAFSVTSATAIQTTVPAGATSGALSVTTPGGAATSAGNFIVAPTITSFAPANGPVGTTVTINGRNLTGATAVRFNGVAATFSVTSATGIQATVPTAATTGPITVTTPGGTGTSPASFTVTVRLTVTKTSPLGVGDGTVTSVPAGISCGGACSAFYNLDSVVNLTVTTNLPSMFNGWSGCDSVSGTTCTVTMSRARGVTANFLP